MVTVLEQAAPNVQSQRADRTIIVEKPAVSNVATSHPYSMFHYARKRSTMAPTSACLSDLEERLAITWQTSKLFPAPHEMDRFVRVVHVIERHFLSNKFDHWIADGSVYFRHKTMPGNIVRVWVDHENSLSELFPTVRSRHPRLLWGST